MAAVAPHASVLGATKCRAYARMVLPLLTPGLIAATLITPFGASADMASASYTIRAAHFASGGIAPDPAAGSGFATSAGSAGQASSPGIAVSGDGARVVAAGFQTIVAGSLPDLDADLDGSASLLGYGDNCPDDANAEQANFDGDASGDVCDADDDDDGLADSVETNTDVFISPTNTGTDPLNADSDSDGFADGIEVAQGSDPNSPGSVPGPDPAPVPALGFARRALLILALATSAVLARRVRRST